MARRKIREWCHWCSSYQDFEYDPDDLGEQKILCPNCGHDHYRRAWDGQLVRTGRRSISQGYTYSVFSSNTTATTTTTSWTYNSTTGYYYPAN